MVLLLLLSSSNKLLTKQMLLESTTVESIKSEIVSLDGRQPQDVSDNNSHKIHKDDTLSSESKTGPATIQSSPEEPEDDSPSSDTKDIRDQQVEKIKRNYSRLGSYGTNDFEKCKQLVSEIQQRCGKQSTTG